MSTIEAVDRLAWSIEETAAAFGVTPRHIRNLIERGQLRSVTLGRRRVIPTEELNRILAGEEVAS